MVWWWIMSISGCGRKPMGPNLKECLRFCLARSNKTTNTLIMSVCRPRLELIISQIQPTILNFWVKMFLLFLILPVLSLSSSSRGKLAELKNVLLCWYRLVMPVRVNHATIVLRSGGSKSQIEGPSKDQLCIFKSTLSLCPASNSALVNRTNCRYSFF